MSQPTAATGVEEALQELKVLISGLSERLSALESEVASLPRPGDQMDPSVLAVISAACAAFLGKRAAVRQIHLRRDTTWARQGRADVQHSHHISHGRR